MAKGGWMVAEDGGIDWMRRRKAATLNATCTGPKESRGQARKTKGNSVIAANRIG